MASFNPPKVEVGQTVLWSHGPDDAKKSPAVVAEVGNDSLHLICHIPHFRDHVFKTGVRHRDDPYLKTLVNSDAGCWDLTPRDKALNGLLEAFAAPPKKGA
jgi:hypothetical protein